MSKIRKNRSRFSAGSVASESEARGWLKSVWSGDGRAMWWVEPGLGSTPGFSDCLLLETGWGGCFVELKFDDVPRPSQERFRYWMERARMRYALIDLTGRGAILIMGAGLGLGVTQGIQCAEELRHWIDMVQ